MFVILTSAITLLQVEESTYLHYLPIETSLAELQPPFNGLSGKINEIRSCWSNVGHCIESEVMRHKTEVIIDFLDLDLVLSLLSLKSERS